MEGRRRVLGDERPDTLASIYNMGDLLREQGRLTEAEPYFREELEACRHVRGDDHDSTLDSIYNLADLYDAWGKPDKAAEWRAKLPTEQDAVAPDPAAEGEQEE